MSRVSPSVLGYTFKWLNGKPPRISGSGIYMYQLLRGLGSLYREGIVRLRAGPGQVTWKMGEFFSGEEFVGKNIFEEQAYGVALHLCILEFIYKFIM